MYKISIDGLFIFDDITPLEDYKLINPKLTLAVNSSGNLSFKMPPSNRGYAAGRRLSSVVIVYKNSNKNVDEDVEYWRGRIVTESVDMWGNRDIYCEGELAYLNDTHQPQVNYAGMGISVRTFLENLIQNHNDAVSGEAGMSLPNKKFRVGNVTVTDTGETGQDTIYRMTNWETTWDCINDKLIDRLGGYLYLRKVYDPLMDQVVTYIDYLKDPKTPANPQKIEFGKNLIDFTRNFDGSTIKTVIVPFGAALEEERIPGLTSYLDVKSVNNNSLYVYNQSMVDVWGWIEEVVHWDDVTKPQNLLNKARAYLTSTQFEYMVIDVNAIDLNRLNPDISSLEVGTVVNVTSDVHNLNMNMVVSKAVLRLDNPSQDEYTLGKEKRSPSLSDSVQTNIAKNYKATEERANDISNLKQVAVTDVAVLYAQSEAEDLPPVEGWSPVAPSHEDGKFMWQKTVVTKANETAETSDPTNITGAKGDAGADGDMGPQGISVVEVETQYYLSTSNQTRTGGSWSSSEPAYVSGRYYWTRLKTTFSDSSVEYTDAELAQGLTNANQVAALADSKADDISRGLITNYYTKTETDQSFQELEGEILSTVSETYVENSTYVTDIDNLQQQIDGAIESFTGSVEPTLSNYPASDWTTNKEKDKHIGDLYLVNSSGGTKAGFYYRFEKNGSTYRWIHIPDNEVQKALEDAAEANAKAIAAQNAADDVAEDLAQNYLTTSEVNSAIDQKAAEITLSVSQTYATQNTVTNVKNSTIKSDTLHYLATSASSGVTRNTSGWTTTVQSITSAKPYLWTYHTYTYGDDHTSDTDPIITGRYGTDGTTTTVYDLTVSTAAINKAASASTYNPASITLKSTSKAGSSSPAAYAGRFKIESTTDGSTWTAQYISSSNESSKTFTVPTNISGLKSLRCSLYLAGGTSTLLDQQTIPIVTDGSKGDTGSKGDKGDKGDTGATGGTGPAGADGKDAYTVILTNENHTFAGSNTAAIAASTECPVIAYKGATQVAATIGTITGQPEGLSTSISNNGTKTAKFTVTVTTSMVTKNGVLNVPVTVDGKTFAMKFTYSLSLKGDTGSRGPQGNKGDKGDKGNTGDTGTGIVDVTPLRYSSSSTTAPEAPTSPVTNTGTSAGSWTKGIPALDSTNKYMYTCDQVHYDSTSIGTNGYTWTTVVRDNALTNLTERVSQAELKITPNAIVSTVKNSGELTTIDQFNALEIGGRNLLKNTGTAKTLTINNFSSLTYGVGDYYEAIDTTNNLFKVDEEITISFDWSVSNMTSGRLQVEAANGSPWDWGTVINAIGTNGSNSKSWNLSATSTSGHIEIVYKVTAAVVATTLKWFRIRADNCSGVSLTISNAKLERGNRATDWTPAPEDATAYTDTKVDGISVGGTQMLLDTNASTIARADALYGRYVEGRNSSDYTYSIDAITDAPISGIKYAYHIKQTGTTNYHALVFYDNDAATIGAVKAGQEYTLSMYYKWISGTGATRVQGAILCNQTGVSKSLIFKDNIAQDGKWHQVSAKFIATQNMETYGFRIYFGRFVTSSTGVVVHEGYFCGWKLEAGNKATSWSEHPDHYGSKSEITQLSNKIALKVNSQGRLVTAALGVDPSSLTSYVKVKADDIDIISNGKIQLTGKSIGITSTNFTVTSAGAVTCKDLTLTGGEINLGNGVFKVTNAGALTATSGTVAGWNIDSTGLSKTVGNHTARIYPSQIQVTNGEYLTTITSSSIITTDIETLIFHCGHIVTEQPYVTDLNIDSDGNMNTRGTVTASKVNGCKFKAGSKIVLATGNTSTAIFTNAELNTLLGVTNSTYANTIVLASNGDGAAQAAHAEGCTYQNNTWYVTHDRNTISGSMRLNYLVFYWG